MKWIFAILLVINVVFFVAMSWSGAPGREAPQLHQPIRPEKIKSLPDLPKAPQPEPIPLESAVNLSEVAAKANPAVCFEWGVFSGEGLKQAMLALEKLQLGAKLAQHNVPVAEGYWVYMPPRPTLQDAVRKTEELKRLGVEETFIIRDSSKWQYAVSLGIFSSEAAAAKFLEQLREKGVKSAVSAPRDNGGTVFQIKDASDQMAAKLTRLKQDFPGTGLKAAECVKTEGVAL